MQCRGVGYNRVALRWELCRRCPSFDDVVVSLHGVHVIEPSVLCISLSLNSILFTKLLPSLSYHLCIVATLCPTRARPHQSIHRAVQYRSPRDTIPSQHRASPSRIPRPSCRARRAVPWRACRLPARSSIVVSRRRRGRRRPYTAPGGIGGDSQGWRPAGRGQSRHPGPGPGQHPDPVGSRSDGAAFGQNRKAALVCGRKLNASWIFLV